MKLKFKTIVILLFFTTALTSCSNGSFEPRSDNRLLMGTVCIITLYNNESQEIFDGAFEIIAEEDRLLSLQKENSDLGLINMNAGLKAVEVSEHTYRVVESALGYAEMTEGAFDPTIAPLVQLWAIGQGNTGILPSESAIEAENALTDFSLVTMESGNSIKLEKKGMKIDLGGIAKGYIADRVKEYLLSQGVERAIINLGGNIIVLGEKPGNEPWKIGIQNPFDSRGSYIGVAAVKDKTVVTSGIYERFFIHEGKRYHHILDPETGYPVENELASVTIISSVSIDADALSTSLFVLGVDKGLELVESISNAEAVFVTRDKGVVLSSGAGSLFQLHDSDFKITSPQ